MGNGYAVEITGMFANARGEKGLGTSCIYFEATGVRRATDPNQNKK